MALGESRNKELHKTQKTPVGKLIDRGSQNPRIQCDCCGRWMRLHGRDKDGKAFQRFYGGCGYNKGGDHLAGGDVCDICCHRECMKLAAEKPAGPSSLFLSAD